MIIIFLICVKILNNIYFKIENNKFFYKVTSILHEVLLKKY